MLYVLYSRASMNSSENQSSRDFGYWACRNNLEYGGAQLPYSVRFPFTLWAQFLRAILASDISRIYTFLHILHLSLPSSSLEREISGYWQSPLYSLLPNQTRLFQA